MGDVTLHLGTQTVSVVIDGTPADIVIGGIAGPSLYELWLADGNTGSLTDFFDAMIAASGVTVTGAAGQSVATRSLLAAIVSPVNNQTAYLAEAGRQGWFKFSTANQSANVTADTYQAVYVAPSSDTDGSSGAWVREVIGNTYHLTWWGVSASSNATLMFRNAVGISAGGTRMSTRIVPNGAKLVLPSFGFNLETVLDGLRVAVPLWNPIEICGSRSETVITLTHEDTQYHSFVVMGSNIHLHHFSMTGLNDASNIDSAVPIAINGRYYTTYDEPIAIEDIEIDHITITGCTAGIRAAYQPYDISGATHITPKRIKIHHNHIDVTYQHIRCEADEMEVYSNTLVLPVATPTRSFQHPFRVLGANKVHIHHNKVEMGNAASVFSIQNSGIDGYEVGDVDGSGTPVADYRIARNVTITDNTIYNSNGGTALNILHGADVLTFENNKFECPLTGTVSVAAITISDVSAIVQSTVIIRNNTFRGVAQFITADAAASNVKHLIVDGNVVIGNAKDGARHDTNAVRINNGGGGVTVGVDLLEFTNNRILLHPDPLGILVNLIDTVANNLAIIHDNWLPEEDGLATPPLKVAGTGAGKVITDPAEAAVVWSVGAYDAGTNPTGWKQGRNYRYPQGTWARAVANVAPYNSPTAI